MRRISMSQVALALAALALFFSVDGGGVAQSVAASAKRLITGKQVKNGTLTEAKLAKAVRAKLNRPGVPGAKGLVGPKGADGRNATSADITPDALTGAQINESTLTTVPSATNLDGVAGNRFLRTCGAGATESQPGQISGSADVTGASLSPVDYATTGVARAYVCTGQPVQARRMGPGLYRVRFGNTEIGQTIGFPASGSATALVSSRTAGAIVSVRGPSQCALSPPPFVSCFVVEVRNAADLPIDGDFTIAVI